MSRRSSLGTVSLLLLFFLLPEIAAAAGLEIAVGGWRQEPSGDLAYKGEKLSVEDELKYDSKNRLFGRVKIDSPLWLPNLYLMATPMKFKEEGSKSTSFTFGDKTFAADVPFTSTLRLDHYDLCLYYRLPFLRTLTLGVVNADLGIDGRIVNLKARIDQPTTGISESKSLTVPLPMAYLGLQIYPIKFIGAEFEGRGILLSSNHYYDLIGRLKIKPFKPFFMAGGYRYEEVKIDESDVKVKVKFQGPFIETGIEF